MFYSLIKGFCIFYKIGSNVNNFAGPFRAKISEVHKNSYGEGRWQMNILTMSAQLVLRLLPEILPPPVVQVFAGSS